MQIDGFSMRWRAPGAVDLPCRGLVSDRGIELAPIAHGVTVEQSRALPVHVEPAPVAPVRRGVTIAQTEALITNPDFGKYPEKNGFRDELKGVKGEFYPCKPDIFEATYEPV